MADVNWLVFWLALSVYANCVLVVVLLMAWRHRVPDTISLICPLCRTVVILRKITAIRGMSTKKVPNGQN